METISIKERLEYLRNELREERISYGELAELQSLSKYIDKGDVELLEAAGIPQEDSVTVFKNKLEAFAKAAEELDNAWDYVDGDPDVTKAIDVSWPFRDPLYYNALKDTMNWAEKTAKNLEK